MAPAKSPDEQVLKSRLQRNAVIKFPRLSSRSPGAREALRTQKQLPGLSTIRSKSSRPLPRGIGRFPPTPVTRVFLKGWA